MVYLSYEEYKKYGGKLDEAAFLFLENKAEQIINRQTFGRIKAEFNGTQSYKGDLSYLCFELIPMLESQQNAVLTPQVTSESNDGVSVSYKAINVAENEGIIRQSIMNALGFYCDHNGKLLLYSGVRI